MVKSPTVKKIFMLISLLMIFTSCTKKPKNINFNDISASYNETDELVISSISAEEESDLFKYQIRIPKVVHNLTENNSLQEFNDEIQNYANETVKNLESISLTPKKDSNKPSLKLDYEIYHGYNIYTIILSATQDINDISITNYRSYYISDTGDYIYNIDDIIEVKEAFPYFTQKIKEKAQSNDLLFDLQQAVIYFENKNIVIKLPPYVFNLDDTEDTDNIFEFSEEEIARYIKDKINQK
ncbi:hypothetical protein DB313_01160 [Borrelia turcica IST7]|uniref:DUF4163 domain-containing protein n=1 Tax=Borrelia turcica IST7 TaxID=1104446 RepID=A0A386PK23_9SPIR|nr:hypothetical protein [Borrelia turcica]AYE36114.1 hypothetical protein DB313_01160 [Borrelia turcica IST7]